MTDGTDTESSKDASEPTRPLKAPAGGRRTVCLFSTWQLNHKLSRSTLRTTYLR